MKKAFLFLTLFSFFPSLMLSDCLNGIESTITYLQNLINGKHPEQAKSNKEDQLQGRILGGKPEDMKTSCYLPSYYPCSLFGDFDGDGKKDEAFLIERIADGKKGIAIRHADSSLNLIGAGHPFGNGGDDFSWMDSWSIFPKSHPHEEIRLSFKLKGKALYVEKTESASAIIYWDEKCKCYQWEQLGD